MRLLKNILQGSCYTFLGLFFGQGQNGIFYVCLFMHKVSMYLALGSDTYSPESLMQNLVLTVGVPATAHVSLY